MRIIRLKSKRGQALLIVVVFMGAIMLGVSAVAGFLFTQRLRTSVDITKSTQAIFAADAGIERQLYAVFREDGYLSQADATLSGTMDNGAKFEAVREYSDTALLRGFVLTSLGTSDKVSRQLRLDLSIFGE